MIQHVTRGLPPAGAVDGEEAEARHGEAVDVMERVGQQLAWRQEPP